MVSCHTCCGSRLPSEGAWYVEVFGDPGFLLELKPVSICSQLCVEYHYYQIVHANKAALHEYQVWQLALFFCFLFVKNH